MKKRSTPKDISIWIGVKRPPPKTDILTELCGVAKYDLDSQELIRDPRWRTKPLAELVNQLSYSDSFSEDVLAAAEKQGFDKVLYVLAQYDYKFTVKKSKKPHELAPQFLGAFKWTFDLTAFFAKYQF